MENSKEKNDKKHQGPNPALVFNPQAAAQNREAVQKELNATTHKKGHLSFEIFKKTEQEKLDYKIAKSKHKQLTRARA